MVSTFIKIAVWLVLFMGLMTLAADMMSVASTVENVAGFFIAVAIVIVTVKTKCLTTINFKRKHE